MYSLHAEQDADWIGEPPSGWKFWNGNFRIPVGFGVGWGFGLRNQLLSSYSNTVETVEIRIVKTTTIKI